MNCYQQLYCRPHMAILQPSASPSNWLTTLYTHTHTHLTALFPGLPRWAGTRKVKPIWILLKQETLSGSGISWAICKSAPRSRQITMPLPHHSVFYRPDALPAAQPTASKHWRLTTLTLGKLEVNGKPVRECPGMHWYMYEQTDGQNENIRHLALSIWWIKSKKGQTDTRQMHYTYL